MVEGIESAKQEQAEVHVSSQALGYSTEHDDSSDEDYLDGPYGDSRDEEIPISEDVLSLIPVELFQATVHKYQLLMCC